MNYYRQAHIVVFLILATTTTLVLGQGTKVGFYSKTCPNAESVVKSTVKKYYDSDSTIAPGLLRMHFHDCFVRGCDASILLDGPDTEKTAAPNLRLRGYEMINDAKTQLEASCPGVVSCADILTLAARDSVVLTGGQSWSVPTGRRDGTISLASENGQLPGFRDSVDVQKQKFTAKGLNTQDLVALVGAHTIGASACQFFTYRLYNFNSTGKPDPSIDPTFLTQLQTLCPQDGNALTQVGLDTGSSNKFDTSYFTNLRNNKGVLESDQKLWADATTKDYVQRFTGLRGSQSLVFNVEFGNSMVKMGNIEVKTGSVGEIRKVCSKIN